MNLPSTKASCPGYEKEILSKNVLLQLVKKDITGREGGHQEVIPETLKPLLEGRELRSILRYEREHHFCSQLMHI